MVQHTVIDREGQAWLLTPDRLPAPGERMRALLRARLVDEQSREAVAAPVALRTPRADIATRATADGLVGLVAAPAVVLPQLAATAADLALEVDADGYLPLTLAGTLGPFATFPDAFAPLDFGDVPLHRTAVTLAGRVMQNIAPDPLPLAGATVQVELVWPRQPPPFWIAPALGEPPNLVSLRPPLYRARAAGTTLRERTLVFSALAKTLLAPLVPGATRLRLSNGDGLAAGMALALDIDTADATEVIVIASVEPASAPDLPVRVTLEHPAMRLHRDGVRCAQATPQPPIAAAVLARDARAADPTVFLAAAPAFTDGAWLEVDDGGPVPEYVRALPLAATSDADGYFELPPISRVALVRLLVQHPGLADARSIVAIEPATTRLTLALE